MAKQASRSMERRYQLLPQMRQYDNIRINWAPYVMFTNQLSVRSEVCNTDVQGFRQTWRNEQILDYDVFQEYAGPKGIVCGGSAAFGVGASSDGMTIPSQLNRRNDTLWFNFGGRATNSTQEVLLFLLHLPRVDEVFLFSGVNNLVTMIQSSKYSLPLGGFLNDDRFYQLNSGRPEGLSQLLRLRIGQLTQKTGGRQSNVDLSERFDQGMKIIERDLERWRILRDSMGFSLTYFLQPFAGWCRRSFSEEEKELFQILDDYQGAGWQAMYMQIRDCYDWYETHLQEICRMKGIPFIDLNKLLPQGGWLFSDRVHLTDDGYAAVTTLIEDSAM